VKAVTVSGIAKLQDDPPDQKLEHGWNAVHIAGKWWLLDPTFGTGFGDKSGRFVKQFTEVFFLAPPERFALTHFPEDRKWQLLPKPPTKEQFMKQPSVSMSLLELGVPTSSIQAQFKDEHCQFVIPGNIPTLAGKVKAKDIPVSKRLRSGKEYNFCFQCSGVLGVYIKNGRGLQRFRKDGEDFKLTIRAETGKLVVLVEQEREIGCQLLLYDVTK
jgi:hypothetical protein